MEIYLSVDGSASCRPASEYNTTVREGITIDHVVEIAYIIAKAMKINPTSRPLVVLSARGRISGGLMFLSQL